MKRQFARVAGDGVEHPIPRQMVADVVALARTRKGSLLVIEPEGYRVGVSLMGRWTNFRFIAINRESF